MEQVEVDDASDGSANAGRGDGWLTTAAWLMCCAVVIIVLAGIWMRVRDETGGVDIDAALVRGERPAAPGLPTEVLDGLPATHLPAWYRPRVVRDGDPKREVLVVNAWASWCGPCKEEAPALQAVADRYADRVTVVGINLEDAEDDARRFARRHDITFPLVRGTSADKRAWGVGGFPETYVVGVDGRVSASFNGEVSERELRAVLDRELDEERA